AGGRRGQHACRVAVDGARAAGDRRVAALGPRDVHAASAVERHRRIAVGPEAIALRALIERRDLVDLLRLLELQAASRVPVVVLVVAILVLLAMLEDPRRQLRRTAALREL